MKETLDLLAEAGEIMAFMLMIVIGLGYLLTGGEAISFNETVVVLLLNIGTIVVND